MKLDSQIQNSGYKIRNLQYRQWVDKQYSQSDYITKCKKLNRKNLQKFQAYIKQSKPDSQNPLIISSDHILKYINMARTDPQSFIPFLQEQLNSFVNNLTYKKNGRTFRTQQGKQAVKDAISFLEQQDSINPVQMNQCLYYAASDHNLDINSSFLQDHTGSDNSDPYERIKRRHGRDFQLDILECVDLISFEEGPDFAKSLVVKWIIDSGDSERSNRSNLFSQKMKSFGGSMIKEHNYESYKGVILMCQQHLETVNFQGVYLNGFPTVQPSNYLKKGNQSQFVERNRSNVLDKQKKSETPKKNVNYNYDNYDNNEAIMKKLKLAANDDDILSNVLSDSPNQRVVIKSVDITQKGGKSIKLNEGQWGQPIVLKNMDLRQIGGKYNFDGDAFQFNESQWGQPVIIRGGFNQNPENMVVETSKKTVTKVVNGIKTTQIIETIKYADGKTKVTKTVV